MTINCERWQQIDFSSQYFDAGQKVLVRTDSKATGIADLDGKRMCAANGSTNIDNLKNYPKIKVVPVDDISDCMVLFQQGTVDSVTGDDTVLAGFVAQDPYAKIVGAAAHQRAVRARHREDASRVRAVRERVLEQMRTDGTLEADVRAVAAADRAGARPAAGGLRAQPVSVPMTAPTSAPRTAPPVPPGQLTVAPSATATRRVPRRARPVDHDAARLARRARRRRAARRRPRRVHVRHHARDVALPVDRRPRRDELVDRLGQRAGRPGRARADRRADVGPAAGSARRARRRSRSRRRARSSRHSPTGWPRRSRPTRSRARGSPGGSLPSAPRSSGAGRRRRCSGSAASHASTSSPPGSTRRSPARTAKQITATVDAVDTEVTGLERRPHQGDELRDEHRAPVRAGPACATPSSSRAPATVAALAERCRSRIADPPRLAVPAVAVARAAAGR